MLRLMTTADDTQAATRILCAHTMSGEERAAQLLPLVYDHLRAVAQQRMAFERRDHTLQATALVHEAYLKLIGDREVPWRDRAHFYAAAAEAMQRILIDHARSKGRLKRGGTAKRLSLNVLDLASDDDPGQIIAVHEAIERLQAENPELASIVRFRFYAGLSLDDTAEAMQIPRRTLDRRWELAKAWLYRSLEEFDREDRR